MKLLADTHTLLLLVDSTEHARLPKPAKSALLNPANELLVSAITPWEISLKNWLGRFPEGPLILEVWDTVIARLRATVVPLTSQHGILAGRLDWLNKDPFDRMIAAQAIIEDASLVSADESFDAVQGVRRLWD